MPIWTDAVVNAIRRHVARTGSPIFTRRELIAGEGEAMIAETRTTGETPLQTMGRELQQLRDAGRLEFVERGRYLWLGDMRAGSGKGVFVTRASPDDRPERHHRLPRYWRRHVAHVAGDWIVYQFDRGPDSRGYRAIARVDGIVPDPDDDTAILATIGQGTYLEFGRDVPLLRDEVPLERGLADRDGGLRDDRAAQPVRLIAEEDFAKIRDCGLADGETLLPRVDEPEPLPPGLAEAHDEWIGPIDRQTMLVNRTVRDRQFRRRVLDVYGSRCALTGMKLINGGGRAETQAAHIMSVEAGGPDAVNNGIALSGTIHWMFDRGLISLSDDGDILLSHAINDVSGVERLIHPDRKARFPAAAADRPRSEYLCWHRTMCFHH